MKYFILVLFIYLIITFIKYNQKKLANNNNTNYGNIIDRMIILYLYCEGDKDKFKKLKNKYYNKEIYKDDIFLFDFDYKFNISLHDKIILFFSLYFHCTNLWIIKLDCKNHMYKFIDFVINNYIKQNKIINLDNNLKETICIHFRCSDSPFNRCLLYELVTLNFYKEAIKIALSKQKISRIIILSSTKHRGDVNNIFLKKTSKNQSLINQEYCSEYLKEYIKGLKEYLENYNILIEIKSNDISTDLYYLKNSACSIVTAGTFGLYGAYASNNLLILSDNVKNNIYRDNIVVIKDNIIKHKNVKDYYDLDEMKQYINN
jgi:hypothetical protein